MDLNEHAPMIAAHLVLLSVFVVIVVVSVPWLFQVRRRIATTDGGLLVLGALLAMTVIAWEAAFYGLARYFLEFGGPNLWAEPWTRISSVARGLAMLAALVLLSGLRRLICPAPHRAENQILLATCAAAAASWAALAWWLA